MVKPPNCENFADLLLTEPIVASFSVSSNYYRSRVSLTPCLVSTFKLIPPFFPSYGLGLRGASTTV